MKATLLSALLALSFVSFSCSKDDEEPPKTETPKEYQLPGLYLGTYTITQVPSQPPLRYVLSIEPDGTITTESTGGDGKTYYSEGTWTLTGTEVKATFTTINRVISVVTQSATLTFDKTEGKLLNGTWKDVVNPDGYIDGKFQTFTRVKDNP